MEENYEFEKQKNELIKKLDEEINLNGNPCISISSVLELIKEPFNKIEVATKTYNKHFNNPNSEYYQMTVEQICEKWEQKGADSRHYGSLLDNYIGYNLNNETDELELFNLDYDRDNDERLNGLCNSFDEFVNDYLKNHPELIYITREKSVFYNIPGTDQYITGRFDALFFNTLKKRFLIVDWKSSAEIEKKSTPWTTKLLGPCKDLLNLNWYTYTLQVYFYKTALENNYCKGYDVDCVIVQLPGTIVTESNKLYNVNNPAFEYNKEYMDKLFIYAHKKKILLDKKNE